MGLARALILIQPRVRKHQQILCGIGFCWEACASSADPDSGGYLSQINKPRKPRSESIYQQVSSKI
jgi:hypothetical protein